MKGAVVVVLGALAATAHAGVLDGPSRWQEDKPGGLAVSKHAGAVSHFRGESIVAIAAAFTAPDGPGAFYVTEIAGSDASDRGAAARIELDSFLAAPGRAQLGGATIAVISSTTSVNREAKQVEANMQWRDDTAGTETQARLVIVARGAERLLAVSAECVFTASTTAAARGACVSRLAALSTDIPPAERTVLTLPPEASAPPPAEPATAAVAPHQTMSELPSSRTPMPPIVVGTDTKRPIDRRPVYAGLGIVMLAAVFWWNRRRRERFEAEGLNTDERNVER